MVSFGTFFVQSLACTMYHEMWQSETVSFHVL